MMPSRRDSTVRPIRTKQLGRQRCARLPPCHPSPYPPTESLRLESVQGVASLILHVRPLRRCVVKSRPVVRSVLVALHVRVVVVSEFRRACKCESVIMPPKLVGVKKPGKRTSISVQGKLDILRRVDSAPAGLSKSGLAKELGLAPTTLYTIIKDREKIENAVVQGTTKKRQRVRGGKFAEVERLLTTWIQQARSGEVPIPVSGPLIQETALRIAEEKGITGFTASKGWLDRYKKRNHVLFRKICGESADVDEETVENWKTILLPPKLQDYAVKDRFNADEFGLFFNVLPDKSMVLSKQECHGGKSSKARVTVLLASNADGSEKLSPLVIGKSKQPRCFKGVRSLPLQYKSQKKAWMTGEIFTEWLRKLDAKMRAERRRIVLFIDNCPAHTPHYNFLTNVRVEFLPKNCTSKLQPIDQGIIHNVKFYYRKRIVMRLIGFLDRPGTFEKKHLLLNILQAMHFLQWAWEQVTPDTIANCFRRAGFYPAAAAVGVAVAQPAPRADGRRAPARAEPRARRGKEVVGPDEEDEELLDDPSQRPPTPADADADLPGDSDEDGASEAASDTSTIVFTIDDETEESWDTVVKFFEAPGALLIDYVALDDDVLTCAPMTIEDVIEQDARDQQDAGESLQEDDGDGEPDEEPVAYSMAQGLEALATVRAYLSQLPGIPEETFGLVSKIETLAISASNRAKKQSLVTDFFSLEDK